MNKVAYIIPGYCESHTKQTGYDKIAGYFKDAGIRVKHVSIRWKLHKPTDFEQYNNQFLKQWAAQKNTKTYVLGFSFGAVIAFLTALRVKPDVLILCSLSPYFNEDLHSLRPTWLRHWKKNFQEIAFNIVAKRIFAKTYIVYGEAEPEEVLLRARRAKTKLKKSVLVAIPKAKHNISQKVYLQALQELIEKI